MKKRLFLYLIVFLNINFLMNCSGSNAEDDYINDIETSITLTSDSDSIKVGNQINFKIVDNFNKDVTSTSEIFVNDILIKGAIYKPETEGEYKVVSKRNNLISNVLNIYVTKEKEVSNIILTADNYSIYETQKVNFKVIRDSKDMTNNSTILVNNVKVANPYQFNEVGTYIVRATNGEFQSDPITIEVKPREIILTSDIQNNTAKIGQIIKFNVKDNLGNDLNNLYGSQLSIYVDSKPIDKNVYTLDHPGTVNVSASYKDLQSGRIVESNKIVMNVLLPESYILYENKYYELKNFGFLNQESRNSNTQFWNMQLGSAGDDNFLVLSLGQKGVPSGSYYIPFYNNVTLKKMGVDSEYEGISAVMNLSFGGKRIVSYDKLNSSSKNYIKVTDCVGKSTTAGKVEYKFNVEFYIELSNGKSISGRLKYT